MSDQHEGFSQGIKWHRTFWWFVLGAVITFILGTVGYEQYEHEHGSDASICDSCFHAVQLLGLHTPHLEGHIPLTLEVGRWLAAIMIFFAILKVTFHVSKIDVAILRSMWRRDLIVVCGLTRTSIEFIRCFRKNVDGKRHAQVIVIDREPAEDLKHAAQAMGAHVAVGDATEIEVLEAAGLRFAKQVFVMLPDDATNLHVARQVTHILNPAAKPTGTFLSRRLQSLWKAHLDRIREQDGPPECRVQISDVELWAVCQKSPLFVRNDLYSIRPMDVHHAFVKQLLTTDMPLDRKCGIARDELRTACLVIIGFGKIGRLLAIRAARLAQFANEKKLRIVVVDRKAVINEQRLLFRYPAFREACDIEFHAIEAESQDLLKLLRDCCDPDRLITSVAVCFQNASLAVEIALRIKPVLTATGTPLAVRFTRDEYMADLLNQGRDVATATERMVFPFGTLNEAGVRRVLGSDEDDRLAQQLHGEYVQQRLSEPGDHHGDPSLLPWEKLTDDYKESNRQQAEHIDVKLRALGLTHVESKTDAGGFIGDERDVTLLAKMEHERWYVERRLAGWQWGEKRDPVTKTNPAIKRWADLDEPTRDIDRQFVRVIPKLLAQYGRKMVPMKDGNKGKMTP